MGQRKQQQNLLHVLHQPPIARLGIAELLLGEMVEFRPDRAQQGIVVFKLEFALDAALRMKPR